VQVARPREFFELANLVRYELTQVAGSDSL
jgi:hypothetical protein